MSTPVTPATPVTVNTPAADIAAANQVSQASPTPGQPPASSPPPAAPALPYTQTDLGNGKVKVEYPTGEKFEGTWAEIGPKMAEAHINTKNWAKEQVAKAQQPPTQPVTPATPQTPASRFATPEEQAVAEYTANLQAKLLGYDNWQDMQAALGRIEQTSVDFASQDVAVKFQAAQPDFNATAENSDKLLAAIADAGMEQAFNSAAPAQQVKMMQQAHAFLLLSKAYEAKPTQASPTVPTPPPPAPTGREQVPTGGLPPELQAQITDTPQQIMEKWNKARALGLA